jgi:hypothetical protein
MSPYQRIICIWNYIKHTCVDKFLKLNWHKNMLTWFWQDIKIKTTTDKLITWDDTLETWICKNLNSVANLIPRWDLHATIIPAYWKAIIRSYQLISGFFFPSRKTKLAQNYNTFPQAFNPIWNWLLWSSLNGGDIQKLHVWWLVTPVKKRIEIMCGRFVCKVVWRVSASQASFEHP